MPRFLARHGWLLAIAAAYLYIFPFFPTIHSANELPRAYLIKAIVDDHSFAIDRGVAKWGSTVDVSPSNGHQYSNKAPGSSLLAAPAYAIAESMIGEPSLDVTLWIGRVTTGIVPTLLFLALLWKFLERDAPDPAIRRLVLVAYALGSMAMTYSILYYSHQLGAVCIASAWILATDFVDRRRGRGAIVAAGLLAGAAPLADYQAIFAAVPVVAYIVARMWRWPRRELVRALVIATLAALVPIAILLGYHAVCYGSPWKTGYDASTTFAHFHQQGFLGITKLRWVAFAGSTVSADNGLVTLAPWLLLAIPGGVLLARTDRRGTAIVAAAIAIIYLLFVSSINFWRGGWEVGPRYIIAMLPFLLPPIAAQLTAWQKRPLILGAAAGLMIVGVAIYALTSATFPYWPDTVANPFYDVTLRLLADNLAAPNLGSWVGIPGVLGIAPYLAIVAGLVGWAIVRVASWRGLAIAIAVACAILVAYRWFPRGDAEHAYQFVHSAVTNRAPVP